MLFRTLHVGRLVCVCNKYQVAGKIIVNNFYWWTNR